MALDVHSRGIVPASGSTVQLTTDICLVFLLPTDLSSSVKGVRLSGSGNPRVPREEGPHWVPADAPPRQDVGVCSVGPWPCSASPPPSALRLDFYLRINRMREVALLPPNPQTSVTHSRGWGGHRKAGEGQMCSLLPGLGAPSTCSLPRDPWMGYLQSISRAAGS